MERGIEVELREAAGGLVERSGAYLQGDLLIVSQACAEALLMTHLLSKY